MTARIGTSPVAARLPVVALASVLFAAALAFAHRYAVDWLFNDDLATLTWFGRLDAGTLGLGDLPGLWNNEHPVGAQFAVMALARAARGLDLKASVDLSFAVIAATATAAALCATDAGQGIGTRVAITATCFALAFHPAQMEHLLWAFELGWFLVNGAVVGGVLMTERFGASAAGLSAALCLFASFCSAQGAMAWFAAGLHQALIPRARGRRLASAALFCTCGAAAVARVAAHPHLAAAAPPPGSRVDPLGWAVYALEILGGASGSRRHGVLLATGAALALSTLALFWLRRCSPDRARLRVAAVLVVFSGLCVAGFTHGRRALGIDWAVASFHAAPFLVPFMLGLVVLAAAAPGPARSRRLGAATAAAAMALLAAGVAGASGYGMTRARLWAMDRGYARWATCRSTLPVAVMARGSGVGFDVPGFTAALPLIRQMCDGPAGPLEDALVARPALFDGLAAGGGGVGPALDALWEDYATELMLQLAFKPGDADTPQRLVGFAKANAEKGSELDPARLAPFAATYRGLAP